MNITEVRAPDAADGSEGLLALVIVGSVDGYGAHFLTSPNSPLQAAVLCRPAGYAVPPHAHHNVNRSFTAPTQEVLVVRRGSVLLTVFTTAGVYAGSFVLGPGDFVVLLAGGHSLEWNVEGEVIEVKQGPYLGKDTDKFSIS